MTAARRSFLRFHVLPWVLGALVLRAMIPMGYMPTPGTTLAVAMCSPGMSVAEIEIPGAVPQMQCDFCLVPALAAAPAQDAAPTFASRVDTAPPAIDSPQSRFPLVRAQSARAPPA